MTIEEELENQIENYKTLLKLGYKEVELACLSEEQVLEIIDGIN